MHRRSNGRLDSSLTGWPRFSRIEARSSCRSPRGGTFLFWPADPDLFAMAEPLAPNPAASSSLLPTYARIDVAFERGEGCWLETNDGRRFLDFGAGIAVCCLGHSHPHLVGALTEQAQKLWHVSNLFRIPEAERLASRLVANTFADYVFFTNSGAEALEGA